MEFNIKTVYSNKRNKKKNSTKSAFFTNNCIAVKRYFKIILTDTMCMDT